MGSKLLCLVVNNIHGSHGIVSNNFAQSIFELNKYFVLNGSEFSQKLSATLAHGTYMHSPESNMLKGPYEQSVTSEPIVTPSKKNTNKSGFFLVGYFLR